MKKQLIIILSLGIFLGGGYTIHMQAHPDKEQVDHIEKPLLQKEIMAEASDNIHIKQEEQRSVEEKGWKLGFPDKTLGLETNAIAYQQGEEVKVDLDGDSVLESIQYKVNEQQNDFHNKDQEYMQMEEQMEFVINGKSRLTKENAEGELILETPSSKFIIVDIDEKDNYKEIGFIDEGPSADYTTTYFRYDHGRLIYLGMTYDDRNGITGDGKIISSEVANILQTWWIDKIYELKDNQLEVVQQELYKTDFVVSLLMDLPIYKGKDGTSETFDVKKGEKIRLVGTDNISWIAVETQDGRKGWVKIDEYSTIHSAGLDALEVFEGLCYAG